MSHATLKTWLDLCTQQVSNLNLKQLFLSDDKMVQGREQAAELTRMQEAQDSENARIDVEFDDVINCDISEDTSAAEMKELSKRQSEYNIACQRSETAFTTKTNALMAQNAVKEAQIDQQLKMCEAQGKAAEADRGSADEALKSAVEKEFSFSMGS